MPTILQELRSRAGGETPSQRATLGERGRVMERRGWKRRVARRGGVAAHVVTFTNLGCGFAAIPHASAMPRGRSGSSVMASIVGRG